MPRSARRYGSSARNGESSPDAPASSSSAGGRGDEAGGHRQLARQPFEREQVVIERDRRVAVDGEPHDLGGDERVAVAVPADPRSHRHRPARVDGAGRLGAVGDHAFEFGGDRRERLEEAGVVVAERLVDLVADAQLRQAQERGLPQRDDADRRAARRCRPVRDRRRRRRDRSSSRSAISFITCRIVWRRTSVGWAVITGLTRRSSTTDRDQRRRRPRRGRADRSWRRGCPVGTGCPRRDGGGAGVRGGRPRRCWRAAPTSRRRGSRAAARRSVDCRATRADSSTSLAPARRDSTATRRTDSTRSNVSSPAWRERRRPAGVRGADRQCRSLHVAERRRRLLAVCIGDVRPSDIRPVNMRRTVPCGERRLVDKMHGMRVVFATAELSPVATVGGLAAAAAGLGAELRRRGVDVELVMPDYGGIALRGRDLVDDRRSRLGRAGDDPGRSPRRRRPPAPRVGAGHGAARIPYLQPSGHGWADNSERFFRFSAAVAAYVERRSARRAAPQRLAHGDGAGGHRSGHADGAVDPQPRLPGHHRRVVAEAARSAGRPLRMVGRHQPAVGRDRARRPGRRRVAATTPARSPRHEGGFGLDEPLRDRGDGAGRDPQRHRHRGVGPGHRSAPRRADVRRVRRWSVARPNRTALLDAARTADRRRAARRRWSPA